MTILEIAGFALVAIGAFGLGWACWAQRREIERLNGLYDEALKEWGKAASKARADIVSDTAFQSACIRLDDRTRTLQAIADATRNGKSGTARKVHRMATEGLGDGR